VSEQKFIHGDLFESKTSAGQRLKEWIYYELWSKKLNSPLGLSLLLLAGIPIAWALANLEIKVSVIMFLALIGFPLIIFSLFNIPFALMMMLFISGMIPVMGKIIDAPIGTLLDLLIMLSLVGILLRQIKDRDWTFMKHQLVRITLIWLYYNILQVLNPWAESKLAWVYTVRSVAIQQIVLFVAIYAYQHNRKAIFIMLKVLIGFCFIYAIYGLKQEFFGLFSFEKTWLYADPDRFELMFQWGRLRLPSLCTDPTTFGILMACFALFCAALFMGPVQQWQRIILGICIGSSLLAMAYTGTRTAFVLVPIGAIFYGGLNFSKRILILGVIFGMIGGVFVLKSTGNSVIWRIQTAFRPSEDASMNLRLDNQRKIQPYIQTHPIGGGLGSCGLWGARFTPDSELAQFAHDSSFVRMGVELGWIGLILYTLLHYFVLRTGIFYFVRCRDPLIKAIYAGITTWCFMLTVACYAQEAILQLPMNIIYNILLGIIVCLKNFDPAYQEAAAQEGTVNI
jgi:putative inorganic carbon (hco3(-)) transporter